MTCGTGGDNMPPFSWSFFITLCSIIYHYPLAPQHQYGYRKALKDYYAAGGQSKEFNDLGSITSAMVHHSPGG